MPEAPPASRTQVKSRSGCQRCKQRKIKCDETVPNCNQCTRKGYDCPGYNRPVKWSSKYQILETSPEQKTKPTTSQQDVPGFADGVRKLQATLTQPSSAVNHLPGTTLSKHRSVFKTTPLSSSSSSSSSSSASAPSPSAGRRRSNESAGRRTVNTAASSSSPFSSPTGTTELPLGSSPLRYRHDARTETKSSTSTQAKWAMTKVTGIPAYLEDRSTSISRHYFTSVCLVSCCFDSPKNSFRVVVADLMLTSPLLYNSVMALSAAVMGQNRSDMIAASFEHQIEAIRYMKSEVMMITGDKPSSQVTASRVGPVGPEVLISCILLGLTDAWHNPTIPPANHLQGLRVLFKNWVSAIKKSSNTSLAVACSSSARSFLVGIISFWESSACTGITQPVEVVDYLFPFCDQEHVDQIYPNPWTGICTPLFIFWAKTGNLARHKSLLRRVFGNAAADCCDRRQANLVEQAWEVERALLRYQIPAIDKVEHTDDELTPVSHLQSVGLVLKLATLLQLYLDFPELLRQRVSTDTTPSPPGYEIGDLPVSTGMNAKMLAMAARILSIAATIPFSSGAHSSLLLPLIVAGTTLQPSKIYSVMHSLETSKDVLSPEVLSLATCNQDGVVGYLRWRDYIREQVHGMCRRLGLKSVIGAITVVEEVWRRADAEALNADIENNSFGSFVHWIDLTTEGEVGSIYS